MTITHASKGLGTCMGQTIQECVSHLECNNFTSSNKIQCGLQSKQVVTV